VRAAAAGMALLFWLSGLSSACAARRPEQRRDDGIPRCPPATADSLLSDEALQCWFDAPHGRWRTLLRESHYDVLVVQVEAVDLRDAEAIARRFVAGERKTFSEILVYARPEAASGSSRIRRVRWTPETGFETLDFSDTIPP